MLTNLPPPSKDGTPALLRHSNVVTFFHEFGHIMHGLCAEGDGNATSLAKCPRDFVEAPSQMLENWCWQKSVLEKLSKHYVTGEQLPEVGQGAPARPIAIARCSPERRAPPLAPLAPCLVLPCGRRSALAARIRGR